MNRSSVVRKTIFVLLISLSLSVSFFPGFAAAVVYVDQNGPGGNGASWSTAYKTLEAAIAGSGANQEFWVADGTYTPATPLIPKEGSRFYGGFSGNESSLSSRNVPVFQTIIDGKSRLVHSFDVQVANVRIDGFKIQNGLADDTNLEARGAGVIVGNTSGLIIAHSTFLNNSSTYAGGALYAYNASGVRVENCLFVGNRSGFGGAISSYNTDMNIVFCQFEDNRADVGDKRGGAIRAYLKGIQIISCIFTGNVAELGGAVELNDNPGSVIQCSEFRNNKAESADPAKGAGGAVALMFVSNEFLASIKRCLFYENVSSLEGGALYSYRNPVSIQDSTFKGNRAANGGAMMLDYKIVGESLIQRCFFAGNQASTTGGAICGYLRDMDIEDSVFSYNSAPSAGAIRPMGLSSAKCAVTVNYCTFYGNAATGPTGAGGPGYGGAMQNLQTNLLLYNSIFWGNSATSTSPATPDIWNANSSSMDIWNSNLQTLASDHDSVSETGGGNISIDPEFVDPDGTDNIGGTADDNYQLASGSPCIDQGNDAYKTDCDLSPVNRVIPSDIGAYERFESSPSACGETVACVDFPGISAPPITPPTQPSSSSPGKALAPMLFLLLK